MFKKNSNASKKRRIARSPSDEAMVDEAMVDEAKGDEAKGDEAKVDEVKAEEAEAIEALSRALDAPVMRLFKVADYKVHNGDLKTWFAQGPFSSVHPDKMDEIAVCFTRLAKIRRVQDAAVAAI
jgi:hypothetical protein